MNLLKDATLLVTGGTGSFGNALIKKALNSDAAEIRVFSRDEKKQDDMRKLYSSPKLRFYIGDVRDFASVDSAMSGVDYVFSAAALKQVPSCEFFPMEAVKTNIHGTHNVLNAAIHHNVRSVVCLSTDKAVYPINAMGISKAMMEKVAVAAGRESRGTTVCVTRYGNVMCSRGSVIPLFIDQIKSGVPITVTNPDMTRFLMSLEDSVDLVMYAFLNAAPGDLFVKQSPASTIGDLAAALKEIFNASNPISIIGTRHGEKRFESLLTREEFSVAEGKDGYYLVGADNRDLNYGLYFDIGRTSIREGEYTSDNTVRLNVQETKKLLLTLPEVQDALRQYRQPL